MERRLLIVISKLFAWAFVAMGGMLIYISMFVLSFLLTSVLLALWRKMVRELKSLGSLRLALRLINCILILKLVSMCMTPLVKIILLSLLSKILLALHTLHMTR